MGMALVRNASPVTAEEGEGKAALTVYIVTKRCYKRCTLLTRWSAVLAVDIPVMHGHGPSSKMHPQLQHPQNATSMLK